MHIRLLEQKHKSRSRYFW